MRLNWGAGGVHAPGWVGSDRGPGHEHTGDLLDGLPWQDETFTVVVANHSLNMIGYLDLMAALAEMRRVLCDGGVLRIIVPDVLAAVEAYHQGDVDWFPNVVGDETSLDGRMCTYLTCYGTSPSVFTPAWLEELCFRSGFVETAAMTVGETMLGPPEILEMDSRANESFVVEARR